MTPPTPSDDAALCLASLEAAVAGGPSPDLSGVSTLTLEAALRMLVRQRGADAAPFVQKLADEAPSKDVRKAAKRALYRLAQTGISAPPAPPRPVVRLEAERPVRAWLSGIDGTGARAVWIVFEGGIGGGMRLCSLILNDEAGILEVAGGPVTRKRLDAELATLRRNQKLPWVEADPARACALVVETLVVHARAGTTPPPEFSRWRRLFDAVAPAAGPSAADTRTGELNRALLDRSGELLDLPEMAGWFVDPGTIWEEALALLQLRESRLVVSGQIKTEREAAIIDSVIEKTFTAEARARWARRLQEMAWIFEATHRKDLARLAEASSRALEDPAWAARLPLVRAMALRGLSLAGDVALGRTKLAEVSRAPARPARP